MVVMSDVRVETRAPIPSPPPEHRPGYREGMLSAYFLLWVLAAPFVGFALAGRVLDLGAEGDWEVWKAAVLGTLLMAPFAVGAYFGLRSVLKGFRRAWVYLAANLVLAALAVGMPISESLTG
jgi:hypothetical protein